MNEAEIMIFYTLENDNLVISPLEPEFFAYPNPFNPSTVLSWYLPGSSGNNQLYIYDLRGRKVAELNVQSNSEGRGSIVWQGKDHTEKVLPSGIYFFKLAESSLAGKAMLIK